MKITVKPDVFQQVHSRLQIAFLLAEGINNQTNLKKANHLLADMQKAICLSFNKDSPKTHLLISPWNTIKQEFGKQAKHYQTSVELLLEKTLRRQKLESKDTVTALLQYLALKHIVPVGADDPAALQGDLTFEIKGKELCYSDAKKMLGKKLDYWKNTKTALKPASKSALLHFEFLPPVNPAKQKEIIDETIELLQTFCGGKVKVAVLDAKNKSVNL